ncbi:MAG: FHA domain-containing protein [Lachnospiraceae bacterium]|nr:FHA domain-containing protein [Lachnospiraceae bacterium]
MIVEYLRTAKKSYMIIKEADYPFEEYELKMVLHNDIPCLLPIQVIVEDGKVEYWYDVTGMQSLEKQFSLASAGEKELRILLQNLIEMKSAMDDYLLDDRNILFSADKVYEDRFSGKIRFCYLPGLSKQQPPGLKGLFEDILQHLNHSDPVAVKMGYEMFERCAQSDFVMEDCFACLHIQNQKEKQPLREISDSAELETSWKNDNLYLRKNNMEEEREAENQVDHPKFLREESFPGKRYRKKRKREKQKKIDYGKILEEKHEILYAAEDIGETGHTEFFAEEDRIKTWELIYKGDGMESDLRPVSYPFLIGTDARRVDGILQSRTVSRMHARLLLEDEKLYVEDFNSTNGTYLNQRLMPMNTPVELHDGDRIVFATEEYMVTSQKLLKKHK